MAKGKTRKATASEVLRQAILNCGLSQNELAKQTGVSQPIINRFVATDPTRTRDLRLATVDKLLPILGLELRPAKPKR